jgi:hypothetical protein
MVVIKVYKVPKVMLALQVILEQQEQQVILEQQEVKEMPVLKETRV